MEPGDNDRKELPDPSSITISDDSSGRDDEDAFSYNFSNRPDDQTGAVFLPDIFAEKKSYQVDVPVSLVQPGDPVVGWIDFNGNQVFEESEKAKTYYRTNRQVSLSWILPKKLTASLTYARFRICSKIYEADIDSPDGMAGNGEVEDYCVRIVAAPIQEIEIRETIHLGDNTLIDGLEPVLNFLQANNKQGFNYYVTGTTPEVIGINNLHEPATTGIRLGHHDVDINKTPIRFSFSTPAPVQNVGLRLLDVDGGDRVKLEAYYKNQPVEPQVSNLTDNYYYNYNQETGEVYGYHDNDAGHDSIMPFSSDMGVEVLFKGWVDSVSLVYYDDGVNTTGTITIAGISFRKYNFKPYQVPGIRSERFTEKVGLYWKNDSSANTVSYQVEKSYDGQTFENMGRVLPAGDSIRYYDKELNLLTPFCFYRIKTISADHSVTYSPVTRVRLFFLHENPPFRINKVDDASVEIEFTEAIPGEFTLKLMDYLYVPVSEYRLANIKKNQVLLLRNQGSGKRSANSILLSGQNKNYLKNLPY
jgi:hypothetical protein